LKGKVSGKRWEVQVCITFGYVKLGECLAGGVAGRQMRRRPRGNEAFRRERGERVSVILGDFGQNQACAVASPGGVEAVEFCEALA